MPDTPNLPCLQFFQSQGGRFNKFRFYQRHLIRAQTFCLGFTCNLFTPFSRSNYHLKF